MKNILKFLFLFFLIILKAQNVDQLASISPNLSEQEIRIYKDRGITNSGQIFRIYFENKIWKAELIQWFLPKEISKDEFETVPPKTTILTSKKTLEDVFLNLVARNINFLPKEETFKYKKSKNEVVFDEEEKKYLIQQKVISIVDGTGYLVKYKSGNQSNEFNYDNPESYLENFPEIDELNYFVYILKYIRQEFNIKF